jgi:small subunit ribosomal protein S8
MAMSMSDPLADMLTRIRNGGKAKFNSVEIPGAKIKIELAKLMKDEGFIRNYKVVKDNKQGVLKVYLKYGPDQIHAIYGIQRISKPSRRIYMKSKDVKPVLNGMGISVISTSRGMMTDKQARKDNIGGEVLCKIW